MSCKYLKFLAIWMSLYISVGPVGHVGYPDILRLKISLISFKDCWICQHIDGLLKNVSILKYLTGGIFTPLLLTLPVIQYCYFMRLLQILCFKSPCFSIFTLPILVPKFSGLFRLFPLVQLFFSFQSFMSVFSSTIIFVLADFNLNERFCS